MLVLDALMFELASRIDPDSISVDSFGWALVAALVASAVSVVLDLLFRMDDDETFVIRVTQRIARRTGGSIETDEPGIIFLEIDGLGLPILRRALRDGSAPEMARWLADSSYVLTEWETDLSSQTGASQAGILLGSNEDIPAFRWVEKESGQTMTCSKPADCAEIERRLSTGIGLLRAGGASRGNLLSGEAEEPILTVSRISAEKKANPGYRAFFANGFNVTRVLVMFFWEVVLEWTAALRAKRRDVRPRGHRGGMYPFLRAAMCVFVRDLIVYGVLSDMMKGRPAVYATFSSYDEVAHHSGLERADTLEALRKLDQQFGRIARARPYAPRPYELVVLSDHGQTQGATFLQRNGYSLADLVNRSLSEGTAKALGAGDESSAMVGHAMKEATGTSTDETPGEKEAEGREAAVLASGNLGLVYLMEEPRRLTLEEIEERHPRLIPALREHPHIGVLLVHSAEHGPVALGARGVHYLADGRIEGEDPLAALLRERGPAPAPHRRLRARGRHHGEQLLRAAARRGLRVRGADLVPRRPRRAADAALHPPSCDAAGAGRADRRRRRRPRGAHRLARAAADRAGRRGARDRRRRRRARTRADPRMTETVVFIPAWNEEENLPAVLDGLHEELPDVDVLVVDDGSIDRTADVAREHGAEVLSLGSNRGLPVGIAAGYRWALDHDYVFCGRVDADGQHPPAELARLLALVQGRQVRRRRRLAVRLRRGVPAYRYRPEGVRRFGTAVLRRAMAVVLRRPFADATSGLYAVNAKALPLLAEPFTTEAPEVEALIRITDAGLGSRRCR